jgi:hypothetical protein
MTLRAAAAALKHYVHIEREPADRAVGAKLLAEVLKLIASQHQEMQDAAGMSPALKAAARAQFRQGP